MDAVGTTLPTIGPDGPGWTPELPGRQPREALAVLNRSDQLAGILWPVWAESSVVLSLRVEVEALRSEVQQLREEVAHEKAESHRHYCDAQYWRAMHQRTLDRVARLERENGELKAEVRRFANCTA